MSTFASRILPSLLPSLLMLAGCCGEGKVPVAAAEPDTAAPPSGPGEASTADEPTPEPGPTLTSGEYHSLKIAHDPATGAVTGHYMNFTGWDEELEVPRFSCIFAIHGVMEGGQARISTAYPGDNEVIAGTLVVTGEGTFTITLDEEHGGCWNVQPDFPRGEGGVSFSLETQHPWIAVRVVEARQAFFHDDADLGTKRKAYCVKDDVLPVKSSKPGWVEGQFEYKDKVTEGWVKEDALYALPAPPG